MNILLIDTVLPSSVFSGKTVRLYGLYGRLAKENSLAFVRTAKTAARKQSPEIEAWCERTFSKNLLLEPLPKPALAHKLTSIAGLRPYYDIAAKQPENVQETLRQSLFKIAEEHRADAVITLSIEAAPYGLLLSDHYLWIQDLTDSMILQMQRRIKKSRKFNEKLDLFIRLLRETGYEKETVRKAAMTIFIAEDDASLYREERCRIISNGVDIDYFNPAAVTPIKETNPYVVFTGHMNFPPNRDAVVYFSHEILPLVKKAIPNIGFKIAGADPTEDVQALRNIPGVEVTGKVPDLRPYLAGAQAFVCPMRMGSGIKNKVLEAMAMDLPIIASQLAMEGLGKKPNGFRIASLEPRIFAEEIIKVLSVSGPQQARTGYRDFVAMNYSWDKCSNEYGSLLSDLVQKRKNSGAYASH